MTGMFGFPTREAIRVKVKKCEGYLQPEYRKFSVDPQITSFEVLQSLLARAFDIKGEFTISYLVKDDYGQETYLPLLSDWDLDAAFLSSSEPSLCLKVELKPFEEGPCLEDWDIITPVDLSRPNTNAGGDRPTFAGSLLNQMEKTLSLVQRAFNLSNEANDLYKPIKAPMTDAEFHRYLDANGQLVKPLELRHSIYQGGLEPSLRRVVWKHLLNVYRPGMSGRERLEFMKRKSYEYVRLRDAWQAMVNSGNVTEEMQVITNMVRKDVLRTDRTHRFYAGADDNKNVLALFNVLTTYALNHPSVSYCQGMSDLASPLLVTMRDEPHSYVCFCALMKRLHPNFLLDGRAMTLKFQHLSEALQVYDPEFHEYLREHQADDLLFCYRWLLLELKREFAFDDALRMLEVLWSSLPLDPPVEELALFEVEFSPLSPHSPKPPGKENPYTKVRAMRRQSSASSIATGLAVSSDVSGQPRPLLRQGSFAEADGAGDDAHDYFPMTTSVTRELRIELENLNRRLPGSGRYLRQRLSGQSEELESPPLVPDDTSESDDEESVSACSESDFSSGDQIKRAHQKHRAERRELPSGSCDCGECSDEDSVHCNGEILESDEVASTPGHCPQLKGVVPIHLVQQQECFREDVTNRQDSDSSDSLLDTAAEGPVTSNDCCGSEESGPTREIAPRALLEPGIAENIMTNSCEEASESIGYSSPKNRALRLPGPSVLGGGNPFMVFLCLTLLLQQRELIMRNRMDYNELAMHFDKMVRKHDVCRVLHQARTLFAEYLQAGWPDTVATPVQHPNV